MREKAHLLGISEESPELMAARHVWISENAHLAPKNPYFTPVHIMYRNDVTHAWQFNGNGTLFTKWPGLLVTSSRVFEGGPGQYGYRLIGADEFTGTARISPIVSCKEGVEGDDSIACKVEEAGTIFPTIKIMGHINRFNNYELGAHYDVKLYLAKIHLLTYPATNTIEGVFSVEVRPGVTWIYFKSAVENGESGTGATVDEMADPDTLLVVIRQHDIKKNAMPPDFMKQIGWHEGQKYSVGHLIKAH
ncbi:MAG: hypothetical protein ABI430_04740 [Candidatus Taylorbacteria bacterium]